MKLNYIITDSGASVFFDSRPITIEKNSSFYAKFLSILRLPDSEQYNAFQEALKEDDVNQNIEEKGFKIKDDEVFYKNQKLPRPLAKKISSMIKQKLPVTIFQKFWENLSQNPSFHVVNETGFYDFLDYKELPLTEDGCFIAYRGVNDDFYSVKGSLSTNVIQGKVNARGQIYNGVGETIEVQRNGVSDDRKVHCHEGSLHIGSMDYANNWGHTLIAVKVNPRDVVSVPNDSYCQKCRVSKYTVIDVVKSEIVKAAVKDNLKDVETKEFTEESENYQTLLSRIDSYLKKKKVVGCDIVKIKAIQGIFSPECPSRVEIMAAVADLGYYRKDQDVFLNNSF